MGVSEKEMRCDVFLRRSVSLACVMRCNALGGEQQLRSLAAKRLSARPKRFCWMSQLQFSTACAEEFHSALLERVARELNVAVLAATHDVAVFEYPLTRTSALVARNLRAPSRYSSRQALCPCSPRQTKIHKHFRVLEFMPTFAHPQSDCWCSASAR